MESIDHVSAALTAWKDADEALRRLETLAQEALAKTSGKGELPTLIPKLADARAVRERCYRLALAAMQKHHDRVGREQHD